LHICCVESNEALDILILADMKTQTTPAFKKGQTLNRRFMPTDVKYIVTSISWDAWTYEFVYSCTVEGAHGYKSKAKVSESELYN
jgi:hypothetical protein